MHNCRCVNLVASSFCYFKTCVYNVICAHFKYIFIDMKRFLFISHFKRADMSCNKMAKFKRLFVTDFKTRNTSHV